MQFIFKHWKLILIVVAGLVIFYFISSVTGANSKLYNMLIDSLRDDQTKIVAIQAENMKWYEQELQNLQTELEENSKKQIVKETEIQRLKGEIKRLQKERDDVVIPSDPTGIVNAFRKLGFRSVEYRNGRITFK